MRRVHARLLGPLGRRLFAAFTVVAVGAVALLAAVAVLSVEQQTTALADRQLRQTQQTIVRTLAQAYAQAGSWAAVDLTPVETLAAAAGISLLILDVSGSPVATLTPHESEPEPAPTTEHRTGSEPGHQSHPGTGAPVSSPTRTSPSRTAQPRHSGPGAERDAEPDAAPAGPGAAGHWRVPLPAVRAVAAAATPTPTPTPSTVARTTFPITVRGEQVGTVVFGRAAAGTNATDKTRSAILDAVWIGAALAIGLAAIAAVFVSRRVSRPVVALVAATEALEHGTPDSTGGLRRGPGEIGQLSRAFDRMARTLHREDQLRRGLVADVAHELRTPVTILRGLTEELLDGLSEPTPERLASLHDEVLRLGRLVDDLAVLSAAQAAGLTLDRRPVDVTGIARQLVEAMQPLLADAGVTAEVDGPPVTVLGDDARLRQILTNLLTNAAKFTPAGGHVRVAVSDGGDGAVLTVTDSGPGLAPDELPHVFDRFWRGRAAAGRPGSGIGLAVVAALTEAHGGSVSAESPPGGGARFTVRLPSR